jgi:hypothetical protein
VVIKNNIWEDVAGTAFIAQINGPGTATDWDIHSNVFVHTGRPCNQTIPQGGTCWLTSFTVSEAIAVYSDNSNHITAQNWKIYNNAFVNVKGRCGISISSGSSNVIFYNNIVFCNYDTAYNHYFYVSGPVTYNYTYYTTCAFPYAFIVGPNEPTKVAFPAATRSSIRTDPFVDWVNGNYHLSQQLAGYPGYFFNSSFDNVDPDGVIR